MLKRWLVKKSADFGKNVHYNSHMVEIPAPTPSDPEKPYNNYNGLFSALAPVISNLVPDIIQMREEKIAQQKTAKRAFVMFDRICEELAYGEITRDQLPQI